MGSNINISSEKMHPLNPVFQERIDFTPSLLPNKASADTYYTIIGFNEEDMRIYLPEKVIFTEAARPR